MGGGGVGVGLGAGGRVEGRGEGMCVQGKEARSESATEIWEEGDEGFIYSCNPPQPPTARPWEC